MGPLQIEFYKQLRKQYPIMVRGVEEARAVAPKVVDHYFEKSLGWLVKEYGENIIASIVEGYALFTMEVNKSQLAYECRGKYEFSTFAEVNDHIYQHAEYMRNYYWGIFAILFCWSHYVELMDFYLSRFVSKLSPGKLIEVAPGHGAWGIIAVDGCSELNLEGFDVSPTSLELATKLAFGAGLSKRCVYKVEDATKLSHEGKQYDAAVCTFMLEHIENPGQFLIDFAASLKPNALAFVTLALTAAEPDHIYEFKKESEGISFAEVAGFELLESRIARPSRQLPRSKFVPRVQAMILRKT
jgi:2-polyprenyl-3-methyl-5-hydroxy-6-metoxy-1,4-benzoquinol methylase